MRYLSMIVSFVAGFFRLLRPSPGMLLFVLAPVTGALLSGEVPPNKFFQLFTFLSLAILYGGGAIICRELTHHWRKGWPTLLLLGAAFGVVLEGLTFKSFFDPHWITLGSLATYGRILGVNWVWAVQQITFHAVFSIGIPVLLVNMLFPKRRAERWVGSNALLILMALFVVDVILSTLFFYKYLPPLIPYVTTVVLVPLLILAARWLPRTIRVTRRIDVVRPLRFGLLGLLGTLLLFLINWILPNTLTPWWVTTLLTLAIDAIVGLLILDISGNGTTWTGQHQIALISGALTFFIVLAPFQEIFQRQRDPIGMTFVALITAGLLYLLTRRIQARERKAMSAQYVAPTPTAVP